MTISARATAAHGAPGGRITFMDTTRGLAIIAVIAFHTVSEVSGRGILVPTEVVYLNSAVAPIRMPLLVFLSGVLLTKALNKGNIRYFTGKLRTILYPYVIWVTIQTIVTAQVLGQGQIRDRIENAIFVSPGYGWFLALLLTFYLVAWPLRKVSRLAVVSVSVVILMFIPPGSYGLTNPAAFLVGFFFLGWWCGDNWAAFVDFLKSPAAAWVGLVGVVAMLVHGAKLRMTFDYDYAMLPWVVAGSLGALAIVARLDEALPRVVAPVRYVGNKSLRFYVMHFPVMTVAIWFFADELAMTQGTHLILVVASIVVVFAACSSLLADRFPIVDYLFIYKSLNPKSI